MSPPSRRKCSLRVIGHCPCGLHLAFCKKHGILYHEPEACKEFRTLDQDAFIRFVNVEYMKLKLELTDSEDLPRA